MRRNQTESEDPVNNRPRTLQDQWKRIPLSLVRSIIVAFRSAKVAFFRGAKGNDQTLIDRAMLSPAPSCICTHLTSLLLMLAADSALQRTRSAKCPCGGSYRESCSMRKARGRRSVRTTNSGSDPAANEASSSRTISCGLNSTIN